MNKKKFIAQTLSLMSKKLKIDININPKKNKKYIFIFRGAPNKLKNDNSGQILNFQRVRMK